MATFFAVFGKWLKCKNDQHSITFGGFLGVGASSGGSWRLSWEELGAMLEDGDSKMIFSCLSWAMFGHLGLGVAILVGWLG